jgi:hypothetical protein
VFVESPALATPTVIVIKCQNVPSGQFLFIRGNAAGLNWENGVKLAQMDWETFVFQANVPFSGELEFKVLLNDEGSKWEEGVNHKITQGKKVEIVPAFNPLTLPALKKTVIELDYSVPEGKTLSLSGTGPLGNWDRKVPLILDGSNPGHWFISFDGEFPPFEYTVFLDDQREEGSNRSIKCERKAQIKSPQF